jgi:hypothetical protein
MLTTVLIVTIAEVSWKLPLETDLLDFLGKNPNSRPCQMIEYLRKEKKYQYDRKSLSVMVSRMLSKLREKGLVEHGDMEKDKDGRLKVEWHLKKDAKPAIEKILFDHEVTSGIASGQITKAIVDKSKILERRSNSDFERVMKIYKSSLPSRLRFREREAAFFIGNMSRELDNVLGDLGIAIVQQKKTNVDVTGETLLKLLNERKQDELADIMLDTRARLALSYPDEKGMPMADEKIGETFIIVHYKPLSSQKARSQKIDAQKKAFVEWAQRFKKATIPNPQLLDYVPLCSPDKNLDETNLSAKEKKEAFDLRMMYYEYLDHEHEFHKLEMEDLKNRLL